MLVALVDNEPLREKMEVLLYDEMWKPLGMGRESRKALSMEGEEIGFACVEDEEVLGAMVLFLNGTLAEIRFAAVSAQARNKGIGRRLWEEVAAYVERHTGIDTVELHSRNNAIEFWSRLGFQEASPWLDHRLYEPHGIRFKKMKYVLRS
ncbi:GNAT family N-acetyltransferase [Paenibacillus thalictri]|uniref:GNAT family N-acetyltransferase n=1 Tax=Paenibacillus thalictri TaxID=2527873 RepID=A0A4Q9DQS7_9BACL|nr:GNAT family N-acetyltransferase [Paenibacillus thalictri]TBL78987.1 GNAT family N-acetyltransferase [Paenibacillus thalictri]